MPQTQLYKKLRKILVILLLPLAVITAGFAVYLNFRWKPILITRIQTAVNQSTDGLYRITVGDISTNIITGRVRVRDISFSPDTQIFEQMRADSIAPRHLYRVRVKELLLRGAGLWSAYFDQALNIKTIIIDKPDLDVVFNDLELKDDSLQRDSRSAYERLKPYLKSVHVGDIIFQDADFKYIDQGADVPRVTHLRGLTIKVHNILVDSLSATDRSRLYHTRDIFAELNDFRMITADSNYTVQIRQLRASTAGKYVKATGVRLVPMWGEMEFSRRFPVQRNRYNLRVAELGLNSIDFGLLNRNRTLRSSSLALKDAHLAVFLNRERPDSLRNRGLNFPGLVLQRLELETTIDTVKLRNARVDYSEYNPDTRRKGTVTFSKIDGHLFHLSNNLIDLEKNPFATLDLTSLLMDRGRFDVKLRLNQQSAGSDFELKADLGEIDARMFNQAIRPLSLIEIKSGDVRKLSMQASGNTSGISGRLVCYYNNLKIALLEKSRKTSWLKRRGLASIFANVLIVEGDNPTPGQRVREVPFNYRRPSYSSFVNMVWKGMSSALLGSIGLDADTRREIKERLERMERERFDREERRDDRQKRKIKRRNNRKNRS